MYACIHIPGADETRHAQLMALVLCFSPVVEIVEPGTVIVPVEPLRRMMGSPDMIASEIARRAHERKLKGNIGMAMNPDTAVLAARHLGGVTVIPPGHEVEALGGLSLQALPIEEDTIAVLARWGVHTLERFCELPEAGVLERLGANGLRILKLARGELQRPLKSEPPPTSYEERIALEHPVVLLQPLLFLLGRLLNELCARLESQSMATTLLRCRLELENKREHTRVLQLPFPTRDSKALLKLMQLDLEAHPPQAAIVAVTLCTLPTTPRVVQHDLYSPPQPEPERLELALGKIRGLVGTGNVGSPELENTHRRDAWKMRPSPVRVKEAPVIVEDLRDHGLRLAFRYFRPPLRARVELAESVPRKLVASGISGAVTKAAGPWRSSGDWWTATAWDREEWDILLVDGALYRLFLTARQWFVEGSYD